MMTSIEIILQPSYITQGYINIGKKWWDLFPPFTRELELEAKPMGVIHTQFYVSGGHHGFSKNLMPWFRAHPEPELNPGDKICIIVIKSMERYRLEILEK